jgi:hypothetical protein
MGETTPIRAMRNNSVLLVLVAPNPLSKPKDGEHYIPEGAKIQSSL